MIISNGSTITKEEASMGMVNVKFNITLTGDVIFFAKNKELVEEYIDVKLRNPKMPLPFEGHDGGINVKVNSIKIEEI